MSELNEIQKHYTKNGVRETIDAALGAAGLGSGQLDWAQVAGMDQFHVRGLKGTEELAAALDPAPGETILDIGSGLGGPARYLAATRGAQVTGIELTPIYVEIAELLSERTGLKSQTHFVQGDAVELPFAEGQFDHVWTQHVAMNVEDKPRLYAEMARVLKPGGRCAIYDVLAGDESPVIYPTPWAHSPEHSFLASLPQMHDLLTGAGLVTTDVSDKSEDGLAWFKLMFDAANSPEGPPPITLSAVLGPTAPELTGNVARNLRDGRIRLVQIIAVKPA